MRILSEHISAPDFALVDHTGKTMRLSDYRGQNVILVFNRGLL